MSESVIADFVGKFNAEGMSRAEPIPGRVLLSRKRLVLAAREDVKLTIPLSSIVDIAVGHVPPGLGEFFDSTVTIAFERGGDGYVAAIEGDDDHITKFSNVLFKAILHGSDATVKERARIGGRITDEEFTPASISISPGSVTFEGEDDGFEIALEAIIDFYKIEREISGRDRPVLSVRHLKGDTAITTLVGVPSQRTMSMLARYLRLEYSEHVRMIQDLDLEEAKKRLLVALYSTGERDAARLADLVDLGEDEIASLLDELETATLIETVENEGTDADDAAGRPVLTRTGKIAASQHARMMDE